MTTYIEHVEVFKHACLTTMHTVMDKGVAFIGIQTKYPSTRYGYIKAGKEIYPGVREVKEFIEKPDAQAASKYTESKEYMWNSGVFACRIKTILNELSNLIPEVSL